jgi:hypothetical protein
LSCLEFLGDIVDSFKLPQSLARPLAFEGDEEVSPAVVGKSTPGPLDSGSNNTGAAVGVMGFNQYGAPIKQGWLKKKRGGFTWQKRWAVLTEDYLLYYVNNMPLSLDNLKPKFGISLQGCTIVRAQG